MSRLDPRVWGWIRRQWSGRRRRRAEPTLFRWLRAVGGAAASNPSEAAAAANGALTRTVRSPRPRSLARGQLAERESEEGRQNENKLVAVDAGRDKEDGRVLSAQRRGRERRQRVARLLFTHLLT